MFRLLLALVSIFLLSGFSIDIIVPEGGTVRSTSGTYYCSEQSICTIEGDQYPFFDGFFVETAPGLVFTGWQVGEGALCGGNHGCYVGTEVNEAKTPWHTRIEPSVAYQLIPVIESGIPTEIAIEGIQDSGLRECIARNAQRVEYIQQIKNISCNAYHNFEDHTIKSLAGIESFRWLGAFILLDNEYRLDLTPLSSLESLEVISINNSYLDDVSILAQMPQLRRLNLNGNDIGDLSPIAGLTQLEELRLSGNGISDIEALKNLTQLSTLLLQQNNIRDISPLAEMTELRSLWLSENQIEDVSPLSDLTPTYLRLDGNKIEDIATFSKMGFIESLRLADNHISDISPLGAHYNRIPAGYERSVYLYLENNQIRVVGDALDGISQGRINLRVNPLPCPEREAILARKPDQVEVELSCGCR